MISILQPLTVMDERRAVNRVSIWVAMARHQLGKEYSREWLEVTLRRYLRSGMIPAIKVVEAAYAGDEIADAALREVGAELIARRSGEPGELQIAAYAQRAVLRDRHKRKRGGKWYDDWYRNLVVCLLIQMAYKEFGVLPTRNRDSRRAGRVPSGCSLVAAALARNKIRLDEATIQRHIWLGLPGELSRLAVAERPIESYFAYDNERSD